MSFTVSGGGEVDGSPDAPRIDEPTAEDRRKAGLLAGTTFNKDVEDLFARGIAVARNGGDVRAFLRDQLRNDRK